jgi:sugar O-acyltransferase (sialic acid O-acetyltransferase NeuD family)
MYLIFGAGGHGHVVSEIFDLLKLHPFVFVDERKFGKWGNIDIIKFNPSDVNENDMAIIAIGENSKRKRLSESLSIKYITAVHPRAIVSQKSVLIGYGTVVMAGVIINPQAKIGNHVIINTAAVIEHECVIDDYVSISPNVTLCGNVNVGQGAQIGAGAIVIQNIKIGKWAIIGAGSIVIKDVLDYEKVVGNPAKAI